MHHLERVAQLFELCLRHGKFRLESELKTKCDTAARACVQRIHLQFPTLGFKLRLSGARKVHHHLLHVVFLNDFLQLRHLLRQLLDLRNEISSRRMLQAMGYYLRSALRITSSRCSDGGL